MSNIYPSSTLTRERGGAPSRRLTHALGEVAAGAAGGEVLLPPTAPAPVHEATRVIGGSSSAMASAQVPKCPNLLHRSARASSGSSDDGRGVKKNSCQALWSSSSKLAAVLSALRHKIIQTTTTTAHPVF